MDYQQFAEQHNAAYTAFKAIFEQKLPPPERPIIQRESAWTAIGLGVMVLASVVVSGSRTIVEFGGDFVGVSAFIMLEIGMVIYAYMRTSRYYDKTRHADVKKLMKWGMYLAFTVAIVANIHAVFKANGVFIPFADIVVFLLLAGSAPTLALIAGDALGMMLVTDKMKQKEADLEYQALMKEYTEALNTAWGRQSGRWGVQINVERPVVQLSNPLSNGQNIGHVALPSQSTLGHTKKPDASKIVRDYYEANPEALELPIRQVALVLGVGKSTVSNVQIEMRGVKADVGGVVQ